MYKEANHIPVEDLPFQPSDLPIGCKEIKAAYMESPGVYHLGIRPNLAPSPALELLVVTADAPAISIQARSYGIIPVERPDLTVFHCDRERGGREIVEFEIYRYMVKQGIPLPEGDSLRGAAYYAMEMYPEYFGTFPAPILTPWGATIRSFELACGIYLLETDRCKDVLATACPIWEVDLTDSAKKLGRMVGRDEMGYMFFSKQASCIPIFELLPLHQGWTIHGIINQAALMNALLKYYADYAAMYNTEKPMITRTDGAGTNFFQVLDKLGRDGVKFEEAEPDLSILTEKQRIAYLLRIQGLSYKQIAVKLNVTVSTATQNVHLAERRLREFKRDERIHIQNQMPVTFPLTRNELLLIEAGLDLMKENLCKGVTRRSDTDWQGKLPYKYQFVEALHKRAQMILYK